MARRYSTMEEFMVGFQAGSQIGRDLREAIMQRRESERQQRLDAIQEQLMMAKTPGLVQSVGAQQVDIETGKEIGKPTSGGLRYSPEAAREERTAEAEREKQMALDMFAKQEQIRRFGMTESEQARYKNRMAEMEKQAELARQTGNIESEMDLRNRLTLLKEEYRLKSAGAKGAGVDLEYTKPGGAIKTGAKKEDQIVVAQQYTAERIGRALEAVEKIKNQIGYGTTGLVGSVAKYIPGSKAADLDANINWLGSNIQSIELTEMRSASKTGGALGQVSDYEGKILRDARGALAQVQSPGQFGQSVKTIEESLNKSLKTIEESLKRWEAAKLKYPQETAKMLEKIRVPGVDMVPSQERQPSAVPSVPVEKPAPALKKPIPSEWKGAPYFENEDDAEAANFPEGTRVIINGRPAISRRSE